MNTSLPAYWILGLGFFAQALFGARIIVQWWVAEGRKQAASPSAFWILSLAGALLFLIYGALRHDIVIIAGQLISSFVYVRNLQLKGLWRRISISFRIAILAIPVLSVLFTLGSPSQLFDHRFVGDGTIFFALGITGQLLLNLRFIYQLYYSERLKQSHLPGGFWWISLLGSILLITYSFFQKDPVLLVAQGLALVPYIRNIALIRKSKHPAHPANG